MKLLARIFSLLLIASLFVACGDDDDNEVAPEPTFEDASLEFSAQNPPVEIPSGLQQADDPNAAAISGQLQLVNSLSTGFASFFEVPEGATRSTTPINTSGRVDATQNNVVVYTYTSTFQDPETGETSTYTVAYQITDLGTDFFLELFFQFDGGEYFKFLEGQESKGQLRNGYLEIYYTAFDGQQSDTPAITFDWNESSNGLFEFSYFTEGSSVEIVVNPDNSGSLEAFEGGSLYFSATWNAEGTAGTYAYYDGSGNATDSGNWPS